MQGTVRRSHPLDGEDLGTLHWEDARHWMAVYSDLIRFKVGLLARVEREIPKLAPVAQKSAMVDLEIIGTQMEGYQERLDLWYQRLWDLQGLRLEAEGSTVRHRSGEAHLTRREFQLLEFLLDHPHRFFTAPQLLSRAWSDPALHVEEVRNYVRRLRRILSSLGIPVQLVNRHGKGYSLVVDVRA